MGTTTFSGPIKAGTIKETTGTTVGSDVKNTGQVVMVQSAAIDIIGNSANTVIATLPANSQIIDIHLDVAVANDDTNAATVSIGTASNASAYVAASNVKATGRTSVSVVTNIADVGTSDSNVVAVFAATDGDGANGTAYGTVTYVQNNNLA